MHKRSSETVYVIDIVIARVKRFQGSQDDEIDSGT